MARQYTRQRALVDGLMDFQARLMQRHDEDRNELRRLTGIALLLEAQRRTDGSPERVAKILAENGTLTD